MSIQDWAVWAMRAGQGVSGRPGGAGPAGRRWRAPWASDPAQSRGRVHAEPVSPYRSPFQRDRDRIVHTNAFRRLLGKTQVFVQHEGDHHRTRLTHTLEVAQIARSIARPLGLDEDLTEALALAHDLGHTPFGHAGERALNATLADHGGFDHNAQSLRIVTELERRYPEFDGLNLSWETLEGLVKHNGPVRDDTGQPAGAYAGGALPYAIARQLQVDDLDAARPASLEAQVAAISDDIAYDSHDIDDALRSGILTPQQLCENPLCGDIVTATMRAYPDLDADRIGYELVRQLITRMIEDVVANTFSRLERGGVGSPEDVRAAGTPICCFSDKMSKAEAELKTFLYANIYKLDRVDGPARVAGRIVADLAGCYINDPRSLPVEWRAGLDEAAPDAVARRAADYVAGMTDRFALGEHRRLFDETPELG